MRDDAELVAAVAAVLLAGEQTADAAAGRVATMLGRAWGWVPGVAQRYIAAFEGQTRPRCKDVRDFLRRDRGFRVRHLHKAQVRNWIAGPPRMQAARWNVPPMETSADLAGWFGLSVGELEWFADLGGYCRKTRNARLQHYRYRTLRKPSGGTRLIESPKRNMKEIQRRILAQILDKVPSHDSAHGFVRRRSIVTFAAPHVDRQVVLRLDLTDFFSTVTWPRVAALFRTLGYPEHVADLLAGLCTHATPFRLIRRHASAHLPQGAPTSPALANLCAWRLDCRLAGLAASAGASYSRYSDDMAFSGGEDFARGVERFAAQVAAIACEEGFCVNHRKTQIMRRGVRQRIAGVVVNRRPNVSRAEYDRLKATLHNCVRRGPNSQNREAHPDFRAHLQGRVAFVEMVNRERGAKLRALLDRITWQ